MKKAELDELKKKVIEEVRHMPYGERSTTARIAHRVAPSVELDSDDLFELEDAIYTLDGTNEFVLDKFEHFNLIQGLPYNLDFIKLENKGIPENGCCVVEFGYTKGIYRDIVEGQIDLRTGRIVVDDNRKSASEIYEVSDSVRKSLSKLFMKNDFVDEEKELKVCEDIVISDGISWYVSVLDDNFEPHKIHGTVVNLKDIPMKGAKKLFDLLR